MLRFGATIKGNVVVAFADHRLPANESIGNAGECQGSCHLSHSLGRHF